MANLFRFILLFFTIALPVWAQETTRVCIKGFCVQAEIADSDSLRQQGLMFREKLAPSEAMLFVFPAEARHSFWMKNMRFPLDIIWANKDRIIVDSKSGVTPCQDNCESLVPQFVAKYVLEVKAGFVEEHNIKTGDILNFNLP